MKFDFQNMSNYQLDVLKEVSNIGGGNAATALSKMLKRRVDMGVPRIQLLEFAQVGSILGDEEKIVAGVIVQVTGSINGLILLILEHSDVNKLVEILTGKKYHTLEDLDDMALSAIRETGNILSGAYMSALASLTKLSVKCLFPDVAIDMAASILSMPAIMYGQISDKVLYIDSEFDEDQDNVKAKMFLILEEGSFEMLLTSLGAMSDDNDNKSWNG
jgi:chemotaxis protein CheC